MKAHGVELGWLCIETCFDVAQTLAIGQLGKGHGAELFGATEAAHPAVAAITGHAAGKRGPGKKIHQLRKQQLASVHRRLQKNFLVSASRQFQIDTTQKQPQLIKDQRVAANELAVNRTVMRRSNSNNLQEVDNFWCKTLSCPKQTSPNNLTRIEAGKNI